jgi:hypothetical protein
MTDDLEVGEDDRILLGENEFDPVMAAPVNRVGRRCQGARGVRPYLGAGTGCRPAR